MNAPWWRAVPCASKSDFDVTVCWRRGLNVPEVMFVIDRISKIGEPPPIQMED